MPSNYKKNNSKIGIGGDFAVNAAEVVGAAIKAATDKGLKFDVRPEAMAKIHSALATLTNIQVGHDVSKETLTSLTKALQCLSEVEVRVRPETLEALTNALQRAHVTLRLESETMNDLSKIFQNACVTLSAHPEVQNALTKFTEAVSKLVDNGVVIDFRNELTTMLAQSLNAVIRFKAYLDAVIYNTAIRVLSTAWWDDEQWTTWLFRQFQLEKFTENAMVEADRHSTATNQEMRVLFTHARDQWIVAKTKSTMIAAQAIEFANFTIDEVRAAQQRREKPRRKQRLQPLRSVAAGIIIASLAYWACSAASLPQSKRNGIVASVGIGGFAYAIYYRL